MKTFAKVFNDIREFEVFLRINKLKCIKYDIVNDNVLALFERTGELMLMYYNGKIFYEGDDIYHDVSVAIEEQIVNEDMDLLFEKHGINLEYQLGENLQKTIESMSDDTSSFIGNVDVNKITLNDLMHYETWDEINDEFYYSLKSKFEI